MVEREGALHSMLVRVELKKEAFTDNILELMELQDRISHRLRNALNVGVAIELV